MVIFSIVNLVCGLIAQYYRKDPCMVSLTAVVVSLASNDGAKVKGSLEPQLFSAILSVFIIVLSRFHRCSHMVMKNTKKGVHIFKGQYGTYR